MVEGFYQDCRYGLRTLLKTPGFTIAAVLTLALGVGANAAIFSLVDGVLLKPVPYSDPNNILLLWEKLPGYDRALASPLNYLDWRNQNKVFQYTAAVAFERLSSTLSGSGQPEALNVQTVSPSYFDVLGVSAALGRTFAPDEAEPGKDQVVILSGQVWKSRFGSDPKIIGKSIRLDGRPYTVIGVLPSGSVFDRSLQDVWLPLAIGPDDMTRDFHWLRVLARLKPGVSMALAQADMDGIASRLEAGFPESNKGRGVHLDRLVDQIVGQDLASSLYLLLATVAFVLLIACANIANLLLARGTARSKEIAIRAALGAGRARVVRQLLTESILLALAGALLGLPLGYGLMRGIVAELPALSLPPEADIQLDYRVLGFLLVISLLAAMIFGIGPAVHGASRGPSEALKEGGRDGTTGSARRRLRDVLVVAEVALALILLVGAGLLIRSFDRLLEIDIGINTDHVLTMGLPMSMNRNMDEQGLTNYLSRVQEEIRTVPGVSEAAVTSVLPMKGWRFGMRFQISGHPPTDPSHREECFFKSVSPSYFRALGMKLRRGRFLADSDIKGSVPAIVINDEMARLYFEDEDPLGKTILIARIITGKHGVGPEIPWQVVGIVGDEKVEDLQDVSPGVYATFMQSPIVGDYLLVKTTNDPAGLVRSIQAAVWRVNRDQALPDVKTLDQIKNETTSNWMLRTVLLGVFALIALLLSAVGIYGVIAYSVAQRTREIGIRAALGASGWQLFWPVVGRGMLLAGIGLAVGSAGSFALTRLISSLLYNTSPNDLLTLITVDLVLGAVAFIASVIPATRAMRLDPVTALRYQ